MKVKDMVENINFHDTVEDYIWDSLKTEKDIDYDTILDMSYNDGIIKMILLDGEVSIITFKCNEVKIYLT